jgi:ankyrin repeat protein
MEFKLRFRDIEEAISDIFSQTAYRHYQPTANEPSIKDNETIHEECIEEKDNNLRKNKKIDSTDVLEKICNWMISLANMLIPKEMLGDTMYKNFTASILREVQNILIDLLLYSNLITLNMDMVQKEDILKQFLDKAYAIYSERSNLYKWEEIELKLAQFKNDSVYISHKDMYVVRFVIVEQNASKYDTKRSERHLIHDSFKYKVVTHHVKNLFYKFVDASLREHCTRSQVKIENRDFSHVKRRTSERQRAHSGRILKHFGTSFEVAESDSRPVSLSVGSRKELRVASDAAKNAMDFEEVTSIDNTVDINDLDVLTESSAHYIKPRWRVVCCQELASIKKERDEHHMWNDNIKFRDSILRAEKIILQKCKTEQKLDLKILECKRSLIETVNQYIINVLEPALVSGLGNVICRATCRPDLLSEYDKSRVGIDGFNDSDADKMLQEVFVMDKQKNMYRVGRNDIINILDMAPVVKQWNIIFHPKILKILNSLLIEACKFHQGPHGIARAIVNKLLQKGADPNTADKNGDTALFLASNSHPIHKSDICSLLIKAGAAVTVSILSNFIDNLSRAGEEKNTKKSNDIKNHLKYVVFYGAYYGTLTEDVLAHMNTVSLLGDDGKISHDLLKEIQSVPDGRNFLPIHYAAMHGNVEIIDLLYCYGGKDCINKQFDANITQKVNGTKVFQVFHSKPESIKTLLKSDDNLDTRYGFTPLALAVQNNHPNAVRKLLSLGAKPFPFDNETDYESAKNNYLCPYWLALGLFRATEDPSLRYQKTINKLNPTVVILKHPNDSPTTHFQKVYTDVKLDDISKQSLKRSFEKIHGYTLEKEVAENIDSETLYSITEALTHKANKERRESMKVRMGRHKKSVLVEAIKHDFVHFSTDREMRDRQLQMLVVKRFRSNYVERRGKNCEKWRDTPLFTFGDNLKALRIDNKGKDRLIEFMDIDSKEKNKLNSSNLDLIEKEKRKEILNIMNRHHKVKNMLKRYSRKLFIWPCIVYLLLLIFCVITVPSFFWESDYAFEVNSFIISELQNGMKNLKESNYDVFGSQIGFENVNELGPWISDKMFKKHLPKLYENNVVDRIGSIRICSFVAGGWKVKAPFRSKKRTTNETIMENDFKRKSYNERDWQLASAVNEMQVIVPSEIGDYCQKTLEDWAYQEYCLDINYDNSNPTIATETIAHLSNCTWFQHDMVRTKIILHFYSKQANLLSQIVQTFSKEPTGLISCQFDAESIKQLTWDIKSGVISWFNTILEVIFCLYLCSEFVAMIKAFVVAGKYSQMLIRQKYKIAGRSALLRTYEEECKFHNRGDLPVQRPTCCKIIPFPCTLSQKMYNDFYISIGVNYNVLISIISSPNENYVSLSISQSIIILSGILSIIYYLWLAYLKNNLMLELEKSGNTGGVDVALEVFRQANIVKNLMIVLLYTLWFRLFDVLKQEPSLGPFVRALFQTIVSYEILMFFLIFMLGLVPVTLSIHLVLGSRVEHVSTIYKTLRTMLMFSIVGEHEQPDFWMHGTLPDSHNLILMFFLVMIILIFLNLLIAIVTDVWQSYDREEIYMKAVNDEIREAVSNYVEGIDYGNSGTANAILRRVESLKLERSRIVDF